MNCWHNKVARVKLLIWGCLYLLLSCKNPTDIGVGLDPEGIRLSVLYKEIPLQATNVFIDSIRTSALPYLLMGKYVDPTFGTTTANIFGRLHFSNSLQVLKQPTSTHTYAYVIDSTVLHLDLKSVYTADIRRPQAYTVHPLADTLFSGVYYLAKFNTPYQSSVTDGAFSLVLNEQKALNLMKKNSSYVLSVKMNKRLGDKLFGIAKQTTAKRTQLLQYDFKGIAIVPKASNSALIEVKSAGKTNLTVHYHIQDTHTENGTTKVSVHQKNLKLTLVFNGTRVNKAFYSQMTTDRSGSKMVGVPPNKHNFQLGDGKVYLQAASGIFPRLRLDSLSKFLKANKHLQINRMELEAKTTANPNQLLRNTRSLQYFYIGGANGASINHAALNSSAANRLFQLAIETDRSYLSSRVQMLLTAPLAEKTSTYLGVPNVFGQLMHSGKLTPSHLLVLPPDLISPNYSTFDQKTGFKIKMYYTLTK